MRKRRKSSGSNHDTQKLPVGTAECGAVLGGLHGLVAWLLARSHWTGTTALAMHNFRIGIDPGLSALGGATSSSRRKYPASGTE